VRPSVRAAPQHVAYGAADARRGDDVARPAPTGADARETPEVLRSLVDNTQLLVKKEIELAKLEIKEIVTARLLAVAFLAVAGVLGLYLLGFALVTVAKALELAQQSVSWFSDALRLHKDEPATVANLAIMRARVQAISDETFESRVGAIADLLWDHWMGEPEDPSVERWRKLRGIGSLDRKKLAVVRELFAWRALDALRSSARFAGRSSGHGILRRQL
jgi:hypothetical protein